MAKKKLNNKLKYAEIKEPYTQNSVKKRIEAFFLDNIGKIISGEQLKEIAKDPKTGKDRENWHQRLSELRTDDGYTILTLRNRGDLNVSEYMMPHKRKRPQAETRKKIKQETWLEVLKRSGSSCEWNEDGIRCGLKEGDSDPIGGGTVQLTPDHKTPHSLNADINPENPDEWQALCGRHQVVKKNYWDHITGKINVIAIVQAASDSIKREVYAFLKAYFGDS